LEKKSVNKNYEIVKVKGGFIEITMQNVYLSVSTKISHHTIDRTMRGKKPKRVLVVWAEKRIARYKDDRRRKAN